LWAEGNNRTITKLNVEYAYTNWQLKLPELKSSEFIRDEEGQIIAWYWKDKNSDAK
jgi:hypothetical protein